MLNDLLESYATYALPDGTEVYAIKVGGMMEVGDVEISMPEWYFLDANDVGRPPIYTMTVDGTISRVEVSSGDLPRCDLTVHDLHFVRSYEGPED